MAPAPFIPPELKAQFRLIEEAEAKIEVGQKEVEQRRLEAQGIRELNDALNEAGDQYVLLKAIEEGTIEFWVVPSNTGLSLQTPSGPQNQEG